MKTCFGKDEFDRLGFASRNESPYALGTGMTADLAVFGIVDAAKLPFGTIAKMPRLPALQTLLAGGAEPGGRFVVVLSEGPSELFNLDQLPVEG